MDDSHQRIVECRVDQCQYKPDDEDDDEKEKEALQDDSRTLE